MEKVEGTSNDVSGSIVGFKTKQDAIMNEMKSLCVSGIYTPEEIDNITSRGAQLISDYVDTEIIIELLKIAK